MGRTKTRAYYVVEDASSIRAKLNEIFAEDPDRKKYSDPYAELASRLGIRLGTDFKTSRPLKNLVEGKRVNKESADLFERKLGLKFIPERVAVKGRPERPCALEDMVSNGARIGLVPNHMYYSKQRAHMIWVIKQLESRLSELGINKVHTEYVLNRHVPSYLEDGFHFIIGAAETIDNMPFIQVVFAVHDQRLGILSKNTIEGNGVVGVTVGTAEEAILRKLDLDQNRIIALDFGNAREAHLRLFEHVKKGVFIGAVSSALAVNNYLSAHSGNAGKFFEIFNKARLSGPIGETKTIPMAIDPVYADDGAELVKVNSAQTDEWLRKYCGYKGEESVLDLSFPLCVAIPKRSSRYDYKQLKKLLKRPMPVAFPEPKTDTEEFAQLLDLAVKRYEREKEQNK